MESEVLKVAFGNEVEETSFSNWRQLNRWILRERDRWAWLFDGEGRIDAYNLASTARNHFHNVTVELARLEREEASILDAFHPLSNFSQSGPLFASDTPIGQKILDIRKTEGDVSAAFAYGYANGSVNITQAAADQLLGALLLVIPELRQPNEISERLQRERANFREGNRRLAHHLEEQASALDHRAMRRFQRARQLIKAAFRREAESWSSARSAWHADASQAVSDIRAVENAYREAMGLQAPVEYWTRKATAHQTKEGEAVTRLQWFFPVATVLLVLAFSGAAYALLSEAGGNDGKVPTALYIVISGGLAMLATMTFWIGRLFTKLYLSEHHLRNDAEERAVMTTTYLALTRESAAEEGDRHIVLNALFRTSPDGIVKDDGPSDLTLQALIARALAR